MIVGTAGHIDHGKTTLVRALTGVDTDRLPEEKKRGISIELGYAFLDAPGASGVGGERIGFIDVPGHERLVSTMLSGATGIDYALLLIAADDGVMPQTREHLAVLSLLGVSRGAVVVTKADRVDDARIAEVCRAARELTAATPLEGVPLAVVSATGGAGVSALRDLLVDAAHATSTARDVGAGFRLAVDRVFSLAGAGTVVTGSAHGGSVAIGDVLRLVPGTRSLEARVRSIHAQNAAVDRAVAGQRVALGLVGIEKDAIARGDWLVEPAIALETDRLDARVEVWRGEGRALRSGCVVHVHIGASDTLASVAVLDVDGDAGSDIIEPGQSGRIQLVLRRKIAAWRGDRVVLRDASATRTIAGGTVLDPFAPARYRRTPARLAMLDAARHESPGFRLAAALAASPEGLDLESWRRAEAQALPETIEAVDTEASSRNVARLPKGGLLARRGETLWALGATSVALWQGKLIEALEIFHRQHPDEPGPDAARLRRLVAPRMAEPLWRAVLDAAIGAGTVLQRGGHLMLPGHLARLSAAEQRIADKLLPRLLEGGFDPPWVRNLAADAHEPEAVVRAALARVAQRGELHQVVKDLYYPPPTLARAAAMVREIASRDGDVSAAAFRDASGLGRKRAIQIVEYFDRVGLLRRVGDVHRLRADCDLFDSRGRR
ncbi:MAG: selenocysteine-specific translation elongation factor [Caldimonas sp.]